MDTTKVYTQCKNNILPRQLPIIRPNSIFTTRLVLVKF